jgi:hypothetical protein
LLMLLGRGSSALGVVWIRMLQLESWVTPPAQFLIQDLAHHLRPEQVTKNEAPGTTAASSMMAVVVCVAVGMQLL